MQRNFRFTRRQFLARLGLGFIGVGLSGFLAACQQFVGGGSGNAATDAVKDITQKGAAPGVAQKIVNGIPITSNEDFYTVWYSTGNVPIPAGWKFKLAGLVDKPLELTIDDLRAMPAYEEMRTFECISNPVGGELISNAIWKGVRMKDLLTQVGVKSGAKTLKVEAFDGFYTGVPIELGMHEHAFLAYDMNGEPLPREHGAPLRCLWPGRYGMKQPKWIQSITVVATDFAGYWEKQGWTNDAFVLPNSRIDSPTDLTVINAPTFKLTGVANSGEDGIDKIDISWDDTNSWQPAELTRGPSAFVWTIWKWTGPSLPAGRHTLYARVTDKSGRKQTLPQKVNLFGGTFPNGTDQMHSIVLDFKS